VNAPVRYYEYRIQVDGEYQNYLRLRDAQEAADKLHEAGVETRIEIRTIEPESEVTDWAPLEWDNTLPGRLGYPMFPGYGGKVGEPR
jgi:hypothetical protein